MKIPISTVLERIKALPAFTSGAVFLGRRWVRPIEKATECSDCGECEQRCPYHLPIRKLLKEQLPGTAVFKTRSTKNNAWFKS